MASRQLITSTSRVHSFKTGVAGSHQNQFSRGLLSTLGTNSLKDEKTILGRQTSHQLAPSAISVRHLQQSHHQSDLGKQSMSQRPAPATADKTLWESAHNKTEQPKTFTGNFSTSNKHRGNSKLALFRSPSFDFFSVKSLISTPFPFMAYGLGGLIPFMAAPAYMHLVGHYSPAMAQAQLVYGACILSFLGGVSWGEQLSMAEKSSLESLSYSILLPLVAWPGVLLYPNVSSFAVMISGVVYAGMRDCGNQTYPRWFRNLRFVLSILVSGSLLTTAVFKFTKSSKKQSADLQINTEEAPLSNDDSSAKNEA